MATIGGPNTEKDNLVFGYDTGYGVADSDTSTRLYPGKPTTNIIPDAYTMSGWGSYSSGNDGTFITEFGTTGYKVRNKNSWNGITKSITLPSTGTYTISAWFRIWAKSSGNNGINVYTNGGGIGDTAQGGDDTRIGEWQRISMTRTYTTTSITFFIISWGGTSGTDWSSWDVTMPQIEKQSTQSPFLIGTRSSTQSLIDLKRTTDIDVSNVSFNSTGHPTFDGTDDHFTTSGLSIGTPSSVSFETVIKFDGTLDSNDRKVFHWDKTSTTNGVAQIRKGTNNGRLMYQHYNGTAWYTLSVDDVVTSDTYIHILLVHSGTTATMYKNGVQVGTTTVSNLEYTNAGEILIGYRTSSEYWKGEIPIFKVYDKALTTAEIKQNYNAYKNRFDI